ncbi:hypothetical protein I546_1329 [Mycobacterium kansasii 732]|nr:hypothetical protein I546_1329 [Mycobacterium kansasii 732]
MPTSGKPNRAAVPGYRKACPGAAVTVIAAARHDPVTTPERP